MDKDRGGVTVELSMSTMTAAQIGADVRVVGRVLKLGKSLGFAQVDLFTSSRTLLATGRHTKAFPPASSKARSGPAA
jgi:acyl-coenzyme A thioesterase 13